MLSPRCLYITEDFIFYHCKNGHWQGAWEEVNGFERKVLMSFNQDLNVAMQSGWQHNLALYESMVAAYTSRKLSYSLDRLDAFQAVLAMLDHEDGGGTICGLPEIHIDRALLWVPVDNEADGQRPFLRNPLFASWSWAGWSGTVGYMFGGRIIERSPTQIQHSFQTKRRTLKRQSAPLSQFAEATTTISGIDVLFIRTEVLATDAFTFCNSPFLSPSQMSIEHESKQVGILHSSHQALAAAQQTLFGRDAANSSKREFIKLSLWMAKTKRIMVMLIGCPITGLAERLALGEFDKPFWDTWVKTEKEIALG